MSRYRTTEQQVLIELLSNLTADYTKLLNDKGDQLEIDKKDIEIIAIQKEINFRKKLSAYSTASADFILCTDGDII